MLIPSVHNVNTFVNISLQSVNRWHIIGFGREIKNMTINELIRKVFRESGLTYEEISQKTGISRSTLHGYASGRTSRIPLSVIEKLTEVFDIPVSYWTQAEFVSSQKSPIKSEDHQTTIPREIFEHLQKAHDDPTDKKSRFVAELIELKDMYEKGLLTEEEFAQGKRFLFEMTK